MQRIKSVRIRLVVVAAALVLAGCGGQTAAAPVTSMVTATVTATQRVTLPQTTVSVTVNTTSVETSVDTSVETTTEVSKVTVTSVIERISEAAACQLLLNGPGGTDGATSRLANLLTTDLKGSVTAEQAVSIIAKAQSIKDELTSLEKRAPDDWSADLKVEIATADAIIDGLTNGGGVNIQTDSLRAAAYDLTAKCGAS